jgi:hypothetical protein
MEANRVYGLLLSTVGSYVRSELLSPEVTSLLHSERREKERMAEEKAERQQLEEEKAAAVGSSDRRNTDERKRRRDTAASIRQQFSERKGKKRTRTQHGDEEESKMDTSEEASSTSSGAAQPSQAGAGLGEGPLLPGTELSLSTLMDVFGDGLLPYVEVSGGSADAVHVLSCVSSSLASPCTH